MMSSMGFLEPSPTTGFVGTRPPVIEIPPSLIPLSNEEVDYSRDDFYFGDELAPPDTSKFSHLTVEEGETTSPAEMVSPLMEINSMKGNFWFHSSSFLTLYKHLFNVLLMTFSEVATTVVREASIDIAEMIKELTQHRVLEVPITNVGGCSTSTVDEAERLSLSGDSHEELPSPTPQPGKINEFQFATLFRVVSNNVASST